MKVQDVMNPDLIACSPDTPIRDVAQLLKQKNISGLPIVENDKLVGIVSEGDLLRLLEVPEHKGLWLPSPFEVLEVPIRELVSWEDSKHMLEDIGSKPISDIMKTNVYTVAPSSTVQDASAIITKHKINRLPVLEGGNVIGIITRGDIIHGLGSV